MAVTIRARRSFDSVLVVGVEGGSRRFMSGMAMGDGKGRAFAVNEGLEAFRIAARATDDEEIAVRKEANARIAILERARAHAYRRLDFVTTLDETARGAETRDDAVSAQRRAVLDRFGWTAFDSDPRRAISEAIAPLLVAIASIHHHDEHHKHGDGGVDSPVPSNAPDLRLMLSSFEDWYRTTFGSEFWTLADHFFPDTPLVDF